jgi:hypothetical protein
MGLSRVFYFLAGSSERAINDCPEAERNYQAAIGGFVLITAIAASLSGGYALYTIFQSVPMAVAFGMFWGITIGAIDRFIVMTMDLTYGTRGKALLAAGSRLIVAIFVAFVIARPLELRIFAPEIGGHLSNELLQRLQANTEQIQAELTERQQAYEGTARLAEERVQLEAISLEHKSCLSEQQVLREATHGECDGTLGTMRVGVGPICELKRKDLEDTKARCDGIGQRVLASEALVASIEEENNRVYGQMRTEAEQHIAALQRDVQERIEQIEQGNAGSLLTRLNALHELSQQSSGLWWALTFITLLFILIEAMPVGLKLMLAGRGSYPVRLQLDEREAARWHRIETKYRERERIKHRSAIFQIAEAVREQQRGKTLETISMGEDVVTNEVNLELRRRTEVESRDMAETRTGFPPVPELFDEDTDEELPLEESDKGGPQGVVRRHLR